jgi:PBP1b-binding outer membrane lipoprotein LpoB
MRNHIIVLVALIMGGCGQTKEFLEDLNEAPQINFGGSLPAPLLKDSIKLGPISSQKKYPISLRITDRNKNIAEVRYEQLVGSGTLLQDDVEIISNNRLSLA